MNVNKEKIIRTIKEEGPFFALGLVAGALLLAAIEGREEIKREIVKAFNQLARRN